MLRRFGACEDTIAEIGKFAETGVAGGASSVAPLPGPWKPNHMGNPEIPLIQPQITRTHDTQPGNKGPGRIF